jgi:hypothetical protein
MKRVHRIIRSVMFALAGVVSLIPATSSGQGKADEWQWRASAYGYFPALSGSTRFSSGASGPDIEVDADTLIENLKFAFFGTLEGRRGQWGFFTDVFYADVGDSKSGSRDFTVGHRALPAGVTVNASLDVKTWIWTFAGTYNLISSPTYTSDVVFGGRMLSMDQTLDWAFSGNIGSLGLPGANGRSEIDEQNWDFIVGAKGRATVSADGKWYIPYYIDIGAGESRFTWQAFGGVGYRFDWGSVVGGWRYIDYDMKSDARLKDVSFSGPMIGMTFQW